MSAGMSDEARISRLEWEVDELKRDLGKLNGIATDMAILKKDVKAQETRISWLIGLLGTFTVALIIASITFALNVIGTGG